MSPLPVITPPLQHSNFNLAIFSVAGFFGGDEVIESMSTLHLSKGRRYRGWYNSPGAYTVAKSVGRIANTRFWRGLFPGSWQDPARSFGLDGKKGPLYLAVLSGTQMETGYMGYLLANDIRGMDNFDFFEGNARQTRRMSVAIVNIKRVEKVADLSTRSSTMHLLLSYFTMISSVACAVFSLILFNDRFCFAAIMLGTLIGGLSTLVIGMGDLSLNTVFSPAPGSPPGDGVLVGEDFIVLRGLECDVNAITKGKFELKLLGQSTKLNPGQSPPYHAIGFCSLLYFLQFIAQLFLIPQGKLPGQIMFLVSFAIAWLNNGAIASIDKEAMQMTLLKESVTMEIKRYALPSRTRAAVFACLSLCRSAEDIKKSPVYADFYPESLLKQMLPNNTRVWDKWRAVVGDILQHKRGPDYFDTAMKDEDCSSLREDQQKLLTTLLTDAKVTYERYQKRFQWFVFITVLTPSSCHQLGLTNPFFHILRIR